MFKQMIDIMCYAWIITLLLFVACIMIYMVILTWMADPFIVLGGILVISTIICVGWLSSRNWPYIT